MINSVPFEYFGHTRQLRFDSNAICDLEDAGINVLGFITGMAQSYIKDDTQGALQLMGGIKYLRLYLYHGLKWSDQSLNLLKIGDWIDRATSENGVEMTELWKKVIEALNETELVKNFMKQIEKETAKLQETGSPNEQTG